MTDMPCGPVERDDASYLTQRDLETRWKISSRTLERWRMERSGPAWTVIGGLIRYRSSDVRDFEKRHRIVPRG